MKGNSRKLKGNKGKSKDNTKEIKEQTRNMRRPQTKLNGTLKGNEEEHKSDLKAVKIKVKASAGK